MPKTKTEIIQKDIALIDKALRAIEQTNNHNDYQKSKVLTCLLEARDVLDLKLGRQMDLLDFFSPINNTHNAGI